MDSGLGEDEIARPGVDLMRPFEVTASSTPGTEPTADVILTILDYDYSIRATRDRFGSAAIPSGPRIIKLANDSKLVHEARISLTEGGKRSGDFPDLYYLEIKGRTAGEISPIAPFPVIDENDKGPSGPPPGTAVGGLMALEPGRVAYLSVELETGWYFVYDMLEDVEFQAPYLFRPTPLEFSVR